MKEELETILKNIPVIFITAGISGAFVTSIIAVYYSQKKDKRNYTDKI